MKIMDARRERCDMRNTNSDQYRMYKANAISHSANVLIFIVGAKNFIMLSLFVFPFAYAGPQQTHLVQFALLIKSQIKLLQYLQSIAHQLIVVDKDEQTMKINGPRQKKNNKY